MKVHWNFEHDDMVFDLSGEIFFEDNKPYMLAYSSRLSLKEIESLKELSYTGLYHTQVVDMDGNHYSLYKCHTSHYKESFADGELVLTLTIYFECMIKQRSVGMNYIGCSFTFQHIEQLFPLNEFEVLFSANDVEKIEINIKKEDSSYGAISEGVSFKAASEYTGLYSGDQICSMNIGQTKRIYLKFDRLRDLDFIFQLTKQVKEFFELCLLCELQISDMKLETEKKHLSDNIIWSPFNRGGGAFFNEERIGFYGTYDDIVSGLTGWIMTYETLQLGIRIWQKQIYNNRIDRSDLILWNGQAIEAICERHNALFEAAKKNADERAKAAGKAKAGAPNLVDYLLAINELSHTEKTFTSYFMDAKKVRDKLTHNNPEKTVSDEQLANTEKLLTYYAQKAIFSIIGLQGFRRSPILLPVNPQPPCSS